MNCTICNKFVNYQFKQICCSTYMYNFNHECGLVIFNTANNLCVHFNSNINIFPNNDWHDPANYVIDVKLDNSDTNSCLEFFKRIEKLQVFS